MPDHSQSGQTERNIIPAYALLGGAAAVATAAALIIAKAGAYIVTGSAAVLATLIDSVMDISVSVLNFLAIRMSLKPADREHRYGHGKIEGIAALFQAAFLAGAGVFLVFEGLSRLVDPQPVTDHMLAVSVMGLAVVLSVILVAIQKYCLRHAPSLAVEADSAHYASDVVINAGAIAAVLSHYYGGPLWVDTLFALLVAVWLGRTSWHIGGKAVDMLLDRELPEDVRARILQTIGGQKDILGIHDLRTRQAGMRMHISFDIELDPDMTLAKAHDAARKVEQALLKDYPHAEIMIHQDPAGEPEDSRHPCGGRERPL